MLHLTKPVKYLQGLGHYYFSRSSLQAVNDTKQQFSKKKNFQVSIIGGTNPTAQSLALLLKEHPLINRLVLYDDLSKSMFGLGLDLSHIPSRSLVEGRTGHMGFALSGADIVVFACGVSRQTGQTDYDLFKLNADHIISLVQEICKYCPNAFIVNLTEPINYIVPLTCKALEANDAFNATKVLGVTGVDVLRAQTCVNFLSNIPKHHSVYVPVICGHSAKTMVPLLSHMTPWISIDSGTAVAVTEYIRSAENDVITLKRGSGHSSYLSALAGYSTISAILNALNGKLEELIVFAANTDYNTKYFAGPVRITKHGISDIASYKFVSSDEAAYLKDAIANLGKEIQEAEEYSKNLMDDKNRSKICY